MDKENGQEQEYSFWSEQAAKEMKSNDDQNQESNEFGFDQEENETFKQGEEQSFYQEEKQIFNKQEDQFTQHQFDSTILGGKSQVNKTPYKRTKFSKLIPLVFVLVIGIIIGSGVYAATRFENKKGQNQSEYSNGDVTNANTQGSSNIKIESTQVLPGNNENNIVVDVAKDVMPSIVIITSVVEKQGFYGSVQEGASTGSGIILKQTEEELLVVTNNHVISDAKKINVTFVDDQVVEATVKGTDSIADLAVIAIPLKDITSETMGVIKMATLGKSEEVQVGQMAIAIGNALGYGQSVTVGYISAKDRKISIDGTSMTLLQTDAAINPGNSGGALLNSAGELVGINSVKFASDDVEGMGYAIPITKALPIIDDLMAREVLTDEEKGYLGVSITNITEAESKRYNMPIGVYISSLATGGAAEEAGLMANDIITAVNGIDVVDGSGLAERVNSYRAGTVIKLTVQRRIDGIYQEQTMDVTLKGKESMASLENNNTNGSNDSNESNEGNGPITIPKLP